MTLTALLTLSGITVVNVFTDSDGDTSLLFAAETTTN